MMMNIEELLNSRLEYCLMKQKCKKYRSAFYNSKVKQYEYLIALYNRIYKMIRFQHCNGYEKIIQEAEDNLQIVSMTRDELSSTWLMDRMELEESVVDCPEEYKDSKKYRLAQARLRDFDIRLNNRKEKTDKLEKRAITTIKATKWLLNLEAFYSASYYDIVIAKRWDWYCSFGKL